MSFNKDHVEQALRTFNFEDLFIDDLGWDLAHRVQPLQEEINGGLFIFTPIAEKKHLVVFLCEVPDEFPPHALRKKLDSRIAKKYREHFIIYFDQRRTRQLWQWVWREPGRPLVSRTHEYRPEQPGESLIQKLETIAFTLEEEETLHIVEVSGRLRAAFNVERATRRFYDYFKKERTAFENLISGVENIETKREYVSVMLNRLMFIYFIQRKGFLDEDTEYLRNRMAMTRDIYGDDQFYSFYRYFLLRLFHEALGSLERNPEIEELIGDVPYLNGGIFELHQIERDNPDIQIPDEAFEQVLDFFDHYQWHLDDRPLRADNEINPDVLGYIFEKYINQKQMGAYYTKEDITEYISKNTIIPYLFDAAQKIYPRAFKGADSFWILLEADPHRYIYEVVQKGVDLPLPEEIAVGIDDVSKRRKWNTRTPEEYALPTEIWRETVARRQRFDEVKTKLENGEITEINDLITYNLDIQQFAQDVIETCDKPETLRAFWKAIRSITILDPTCGSGAFLFAALNILHPLYEACLDRMQTFIDEYPKEAPAHALKDFKDRLANVSHHPNEDYYILKSIIVDNLYGVDIMAEAVEIAKLRLFLKLASQVGPDRNKENWGIEPLPDIDFNIRTGNTLVGFATKEEVIKAFRGTADTTAPEYSEQEKMGFAKDPSQMKILFPEDAAVLKRIEDKASDIDRLYNRFRDLQTSYIISRYANDLSDTKSELKRRLESLGNELDHTLAKQYGVKENKNNDFTHWCETHKPFHWFIEFFGIVKSGGFDVIIGNPPYVRYGSEIKYEVKNFETIDTGDLYAFIIEVSIILLSSEGRFGMIIPVSSVSTDGFAPLREFIKNNIQSSWVSSYAERPSKLFTGVEKRLTIWLGSRSSIQKNHEINHSKYHRWLADERQHLFTKLQYTPGNVHQQLVASSIPKVCHPFEFDILEKLSSNNPIEIYFSRTGSHNLYYTRKLRYFVQFLNFIPQIKNEKGGILEPSELNRISSTSEVNRDAVISLLNSNLFFWFLTIHSDVRNINKREINNFRCSIPEMDKETLNKLSGLTNKLMHDYIKNSYTLSNTYRNQGVLHIQSFQPRESKSIIDQIDQVIAHHYKFDNFELDYITNFDIKYRMGDELHNDEGDDG